MEPLVIPSNNNKKKSHLPKQHKNANQQHDCSFGSYIYFNESPARATKITDYFQVRKSTRRCKSDLEKERRQEIETILRNISLGKMNDESNGLVVRYIDGKGRGIFAARPFQRGDFVCEYSGDLISLVDAREREARYAQDSSIGCYMYFFEYKTKNYCIDATAESGRLGRLLNHSKLDGNCHTKLFPDEKDRPHLILVASRDIERDEELTYDYGDRNKNSIEFHPWLAS